MEAVNNKIKPKFIIFAILLIVVIIVVIQWIAIDQDISSSEGRTIKSEKIENPKWPQTNSEV